MFEDAYNKASSMARAGCQKHELQKLWELAENVPDDGLIVEIGSFYGHSAMTLAPLNKPMVCIDPFISGFDCMGDSHKKMKKECMDNLSKFPNIKFYAMKSSMAHKYIKQPIDLLFIDGDHSYKGVKTDCKYYLPKLKNNGIVAFHDYHSSGSLPGVKKAVDEFTQGWHTVCDEWSLKVLQNRKA